MKVTFKKLLSVLFAIITVTCLTAMISVSVSAADCPDGKHSMSYSVVNGDLHHSCKKCGANDTVAEKNPEGGPVIYLGLNKADGTARDGGNGFTPAGAIKLEDELINIFRAYKSKNAKPVTVVVVGEFIPELDFVVDAGNRVTFTSVWGGVDYRDAVAGTDLGNARLLFKTNMHCYNDIVFDQVIFDHPSTARCIGLNGHNLTVTGVKYSSKGKLIDTVKTSTGMYAILSGDYLDATYEGSDLSNLNQTISVDSGIWICIDVGCYRSISSAAFLDMSGKVTVNISGNAQVINRAKGAPYKYRGLSAASQILSSKGLDVVYNISGGRFVLNEGLNVIGRDSQAPDGVRNISATYNVSAGDFGGCAVYATVRDVLSNSIPTIGQVVFNIAKGLNFGDIEIDSSKDILGGIDGPAATTAPVTVVEPPVTTEPTTEAFIDVTEPDETTSEVVTTEASKATSAADTSKADVTTATTTTATADSEPTSEGGVNVVLILCIAVAVAAVAAVVVVVLNKKKSN